MPTTRMVVFVCERGGGYTWIHPPLEVLCLNGQRRQNAPRVGDPEAGQECRRLRASARCRPSLGTLFKRYRGIDGCDIARADAPALHDCWNLRPRLSLMCCGLEGGSWGWAWSHSAAHCVQLEVPDCFLAWEEGICWGCCTALTLCSVIDYC